MDLSFLQGIGLFMCIGGIILVVLLALAVRSFTSGRNKNNPANRSVLDERGNERPTYDSRRVESSGGFGSEQPSNIPQTGRNRARVYDTRRDVTDSTPGNPLPRIEDDEQTRLRRERRTDDDDDVRSSGGFGS
jgi:hypothetical protein